MKELLPLWANHVRLESQPLSKYCYQLFLISLTCCNVYLVFYLQNLSVKSSPRFVLVQTFNCCASWLVSNVRDYLWCTSKLSFQARFPEIFDQILQNTPVLGFGSRTHTPSPPRKWNSSQSSSLTLPRTPPPPMKFFPESKSDLTQNTPSPPPPSPQKNWKL